MGLAYTRHFSPRRQEDSRTSAHPREVWHVRASVRARVLAALLAALSVVLTACGDDDTPSAARTLAAPSQTPTGTTSASITPAARQPRHQSVDASQPTRLIAGPLIFRVNGAPRTPPSNVTPKLRYALIFRLNRDPFKKRDGYGVVRDPRGNFSLFDSIAFTFDAPIERLEIPGCFIGYVDAEHTGFVARLDALSLGARVPVRLRPVTPKPNGTSVLGRVYRRNPRLLSTDYALASPGASAKLGRIGCPITDLDYYGKTG